MNHLKNSTFWSLFFVFSTSAFAQTGSLTGNISSEKDGPIEGVSVYLSNTKWAISDEFGAFQIEGIPYGEYRLKTSRLGFSPKEIPISINKIETKIEITLNEQIYGDIQAVVTATRTSKELEDVPTPIDVVSNQEIENSGATTVKDILLEQNGITLAPDEENAVQIQGFDADYTLIMIDGQPVIGRTRGALDLSRINVANIQQIEIVKGPSSALWGSDALAGVINIITKKGTEPFSLTAHSQYGSRNIYDFGTTASFLKSHFSGSLGIVANGSDGFDLSDSTFGNNQNPFDAFTVNSRIDYAPNDYTNLSITGRYFRNEFSGPTIATVQSQEIEILETGWQDDISLQARFETSPFSNFNSTLIGYITRYEDFSNTNFEDPTEEDVDLNNRQGLDKVELQNDYSWNDQHISSFGGGASFEFVRAERFQGKQTQDGNFAFLQHQFSWNDKLYLIGGLRLDNHSSYESYMSPKFATRFSLNDKINLRASVGQGFKAPDFRTLYLNFDNAGSGYQIFGTNNILAEIATLRESNLIETDLVDVSRLGVLEPEYSTAYNVGISYGADDKPYSFSLNVFRNDAENLIDAREVVELTNGNSIFGYLNINRAQTQGIEFENSFSPISGFRMSVGYQYLDANEIVSEPRTVIENGVVVTRNVDRKIQLPKRPTHSGTVKVFYIEPWFDTEVSLRGIIRGEYLQNDRAENGVGVIDSSVDDFVDAHSIWNITLSKQLNDRFRAQLGVNNLFNHIDDFLPAQPNRTFFTRITFDL